LTPLTPRRRWARTDDTQQRILDAATEVFGARGFTAATMADVVSRSGASIGSIYHHFGGKKELFLAIFERMVAAVERRLDEATETAPASDGPEAFGTHARVYLEAVWANRHAAMVLASGDVPAGFDRIRRASMLASFRRWRSVVDRDESPRGQLLNQILLSVISESALMITTCDDAAEARPVIDAAIDYIDRLIG
jgi:AcrR family transcriptional regulator